MLTKAIHHLPFAGAVMGTVPEWLHLIPKGTFTGDDGRGPYHLKNPAAVIAASMTAGRLPLDVNHSTDVAAPQGQPSPAQGWIVELQMRDDGIWGRVEWNDSGRQLMTERAYGGVSPVFTHDKAGTVEQLLRAALTNRPNLSQLAKLFQQETGLNLAEQLRTALGLPATADDAAIVAAATTAHTAISTHAQLRRALGLADTADGAAIVAAATTAHGAVVAHSQQIAAIATAAGVTAADGAALVTVLAAQRTNAGDPAKMATTIVELQTQLQTMQATTGREKATAFIDGAIKGGKPIGPLRDHYIARHIANPADVEKEIAAIASVNAGGVKPGSSVVLQSDGGGDELTAEEMAVCEKMGQDPDEFRAHKQGPAALKKHQAEMAKKKAA